METVCCKCAKVKRGERWVQAAPRPGLVVSHGFCPACYRAVIRMIEDAGRLRAVRPAA